MAASTKMADLSKTYQKKTDREHILDAPDTYIGSIELDEIVNWNFNATGDKIIQDKYHWTPGLYKCFDEGIVNDSWRDFMRFQIMRNRNLYDESMPGIAMLSPDGRFAIAAAAELYRAILEDIEAHDYDVFRRRAYVNNWEKIKRLPGIWWRAENPVQ